MQSKNLFHKKCFQLIVVHFDYIIVQSDQEYSPAKQTNYLFYPLLAEISVCPIVDYVSVLKDLTQ